MEDSIKDIYKDIGLETYSFYVGRCVLYTSFSAIGIKADTNEISVVILFAAKNEEDIKKYYKILCKKISNEFGKTSGKNKTVLAYEEDRKIPNYCALAPDIDYDGQNIFQDDFSIKDDILYKLDPKEMKTRNYYAFYTPDIKNMEEIGIYKDASEFQDHLFEDLVKIQSQHKELAVKEESEDVGLDQYKFYICHNVLYTRVSVVGKDKLQPEFLKAIENYSNISDEISLHIYYASKTEEDAKKYDNIIRQGIVRDFGENDGSNNTTMASDFPKPYYSVAANKFDFDSQDVLSSNFSAKEFILSNEPEFYLVRKNYYHYYSNILKEIKQRTVGVYSSLKDFSDNLLDDMVKMTGQEQEVDECCCAGGMGGVTTASFAPAVTNTIYPRPGSKKKKKKAKKEDNETIDDIYGFYAGLINIDFDHIVKPPFYREKVWPVLAKTPEQYNQFIEIIKNNVSKVDGAKVSDVFEPIKSYSSKIKDYNFEGQKILDGSLFTKDYDFENIKQDKWAINDIVVDSEQDLATFTNDLLEKMISKDKKEDRDEDSSEVYWPVRNDETDAFEKMIVDARQAKKDKIIARKEKTIAKRDKVLSDWLEKMAQDENYSVLALQTQALKYNAATNKIRAELARIKKLPLDSPEFF